MNAMRLGGLYLGLLALADSGYALEARVSLAGDGKSAEVDLWHAPDREPLAALRLRLKLKPGIGAQSLTVAKPAAGPWSQFLPRAALEGEALTAFAMAPATGLGGDTAARLIARFDLSLNPQAVPRAATDLIDSMIVLEAYGPDGKPLALQSRLTTSLASPRPRVAAPDLRMRGTARTLAFNLGKAQRVKAWVSDLRGRRVADVLDRRMPAGVQEVTWNGRTAGGDVPARGTYLFHLEAGTFSYDRKMEVAP